MYYRNQPCLSHIMRSQVSVLRRNHEPSNNKNNNKTGINAGDSIEVKLHTKGTSLDRSNHALSLLHSVTSGQHADKLKCSVKLASLLKASSCNRAHFTGPYAPPLVTSKICSIVREEAT